MLQTLSEAERWERGCQGDALRNEFIVPAIARLLNSSMPSRVLDIGAGTGYVTRALDTQLNYRAEWTIIDMNGERLAVAQNLKPSEMRLRCLAEDVFCCSVVGEKFDAIVATFTLLEIEDLEKFMSVVQGFLGHGGLFLVGIPDALPDILEVGRNDPQILEKYSVGPVSVPKIDKFTGQIYPFVASRTELLIAQILKFGFDLYEIVSASPPLGRAFVLAFRRRDRLE